MKTKCIFVTLLCCIFLFSCNHNDLVESGNVSSDYDIISNGRFTESVVNTNLDFNGYNFLYASFISDRYVYILKNSILSDIRIISFDSKGSDVKESYLEKPFDINSPLDSSFFNFSGYEDLNISYYDPYIVDDFIRGYCIVNGFKDSVESQFEYLNICFLITWNLDGSIESVEACDINSDSLYLLDTYSYTPCDSKGNLFSITDSGIVRHSDEGLYIDTYFDYINSSYFGSFDAVVYADENSFSSLSYDDELLSFSIFTRDDSSVKAVTPISLYCSSMDDELKAMILRYNYNSNEYKIGVRNYDDIYRDYSYSIFNLSYVDDVSLRHLEEDVLSGDIPDLIYQFSGYDDIFVNSLSSSGVILNLKDLMKKDNDIKKYKYLTNIYDIYDDKGIYAIIPSFTFDTYVTAGSNAQISRNWTLDDYVNYKSQFDSDMIIMDSYSSKDFIIRALEFNGDSWIDESTGNAVFGDDFMTYLELASKLPASYEDFNELSMTGQIPVNIHVFYTPIGNLAKDYLMSWREVYYSPLNVGFPTNTNSDRVIHPSGSLMLCSDRVAAPGCWDFAKCFLDSEYQDGLIDRIPVLESSYEKWKSNTSYEGIDSSYLMLEIAGQLYTAPLLNSDNVELLSNSIKSCDNLYFHNPEIEEIVLKNASLYFDGSLSADEAAVNTEQEVEQYLRGVLHSS